MGQCGEGTNNAEKTKFVSPPLLGLFVYCLDCKLSLPACETPSMLPGLYK